LGNSPVAQARIALAVASPSAQVATSPCVTTLFFVACGVIAWSNHVQGSRLVISTAEDLIDRIDGEVSSELRHLFAPVESLRHLDFRFAVPRAPRPGRACRRCRARQVLSSNEQVAAIYVGYDDGEFFLVRALRDDASRKAFGARSNRRSSCRVSRRVVFGRRAGCASIPICGRYRSSKPPMLPRSRTRPWYRRSRWRRAT